MAYDPRVTDEVLLFEPFHLNITRGRFAKTACNDRLEELARHLKAIVADEQSRPVLPLSCGGHAEG